jgi:hypothetical protein
LHWAAKQHHSGESRLNSNQTADSILAIMAADQQAISYFWLSSFICVGIEAFLELSHKIRSKCGSRNVKERNCGDSLL